MMGQVDKMADAVRRDEHRRRHGNAPCPDWAAVPSDEKDSYRETVLSIFHIDSQGAAA